MKISPSAALLCLLPALSSWAGPLEEIQPGEWFEAPNSKLNGVGPSPLPPGSTGLSAVMSAWSGAALDTKRARLIVWGGGHGDYSGNELYAFDIKSLKWSRLTNPSTNVGGVETSGIYPDGSPRSRHTYNYITYAENADAFCSMGGAGLYPSGQTGDDSLRCFDFANQTWKTPGRSLSVGAGSNAVFDPATGRIWSLAGGSNSRFSSWDPVANKWQQYGARYGFVEYYTTSTIGQGKFVSVGGGGLSMLDLKAPDAAMLQMKTTGDREIESNECPGFAYHPKANVFVAWNGGTDVYALDLGARKWTRLAPAATNKVTPTRGASHGTFGRFRYISSLDLFVGVNGVDQNVFFYRLPSGVQGSMGVQPRKGKAIPGNGGVSRPMLFNGGTLRFPGPPPSKLRIYDAGRMVREYSGAGAFSGLAGTRAGLVEIDPGLPSGRYFVLSEPTRTR